MGFNVGDKVRLAHFQTVFEIDAVRKDGLIHLKGNRENIWNHSSALTKLFLVTVKTGQQQQTFDFTGKKTKLKQAIAKIRTLEKNRLQAHEDLKQGKFNVWSEFHQIDEPAYDKEDEAVKQLLGDLGTELLSLIYEGNGDISTTLDVVLDAVNKQETEVWI